MIKQVITYNVECRVCGNHWKAYSLEEAKQGMARHNRLAHPEQIGKETDENGNLYNTNNEYGEKEGK